MSYDRYAMFRSNGIIDIVPFVPIRNKSTDKFYIYETNKTRLDIVSYEFYGSADYAWLILQANPEYGSIEYLIPNGTKLRIPYPLEETLNLYSSDIETYKNINR